MKPKLAKAFVDKIDAQLNQEMKAYVEYINRGTVYRNDLLAMEDRISHLIVIHEYVWSVL